MPQPPNNSRRSATAIAPVLPFPFGDINLVVLTDVHSWVAGHGNNEGRDHLDANYGDVVSFFEQMKKYCYSSDASSQHDCGDVWLVQNGDWIDGTGISMDGNATNLIEVLKQIPFDVLNTGNHDLYQDSVIEETRKKGGYLDWWGPRHLSSNVYMNYDHSKNGLLITGEPMSNQYHVLKGRSSTVLVFGFIYNMENPSNLVTVQRVEEAVRESWFKDVLQDTSIGYNAILVMLHAGMDDPSVGIILKEIRSITSSSSIDPEGDLPVQFVAGHTHQRRHTIADSQSTVVESGRYLDTIGWISFPNADTIRREKEEHHSDDRVLQNESMLPISAGSNNATTATTATTSTVVIEKTFVTNLFRHMFLDANRKALRNVLGIPSPEDAIFYGDDDEFQTDLGVDIAHFIKKTRDSMGLTSKIGCAPMDYFLERSMVYENSLWALFRDAVGPYALATVAKKSNTTLPPSNRALFMSQDSWRYGLYGGNHLTVDDIIAVSPFDEPIYKVSVLPCASIQELKRRMNDDGLSEYYLDKVPAWIVAEHQVSVDSADCELYVNRFGLDRVQTGLNEMTQARGEPDVEWKQVESNITTTSIWLYFVQEQWQQCPINGPSDDPSNGVWGSLRESFNSRDPVVVGVVLLGFALASIGISIAFAAPCLWRKKRRYHGVVISDSSVALPGDDDGDSTQNDTAGGDYCDDENEQESNENDEDSPIRIV